MCVCVFVRVCARVMPAYTLYRVIDVCAYLRILRHMHFAKKRQALLVKTFHFNARN